MEDVRRPDGNSRLKLKIKKRNSFSGKALKSIRNDLEPLSPLTNILNGRIRRPKNDSGLSIKRKNPFQKEEKDPKRTKYGENKSEDKENDFSHFKVTKNRQDFVIPNVLDGDYEAVVKEDLWKKGDAKLFENNDGKAKVPRNDTNFPLKVKCNDFPTDWSLKTKIKFKSEKSFSWSTNLKSSQVSLATVSFVRCKYDENINLGYEIELRRNLSYWKHPCLPSIPSFPVPENSTEELNLAGFTNICKDATIQAEIMKNWGHSFQSVFTLAKCGFCPYFYMCCQKFLCLFIGNGVLDEGMVAIVSPTTKGLRELFTKEGIDFSMPHINKKSNSIRKNEEETHDDLEEDQEDDEHDEDFLSSIGLNKKSFASVERQRVADEISKLNGIDNRLQSTVLVKDCHVNALFNFFVNSDVIVAQSGTYQGVPPSILSPVAFEGASLQTLKCVQGPMKIQEKGGLKQVYGLEISGVILPTQFYNICHLVKETNSSYEAVVATNSNSSALNLQEANHKECKEMEAALKLGIHKDSFQYLRGSSSASCGGITSLKYSCGDFEWKTFSV